MNILIKLTCLVGLVIAPILAGSNRHDDPSDKTAIEINQKKVLDFLSLKLIFKIDLYLVSIIFFNSISFLLEGILKYFSSSELIFLSLIHI